MRVVGTSDRKKTQSFDVQTSADSKQISEQSVESRVAVPRAQFTKAADYDPAFRSCTQSGHSEQQSL